MRKFAFCLAVLLAFTLAAWSQQPASSDPQGSSSSQTSATPQDMGAQQPAPSHHDKSSGKEHSVTGCLSGPNAEGAYELTSGKHKVELSGSDELKNHVGHKVTVTGNWEASEAGATQAAAQKGEKGEKGEKHMKVDTIKMVSESCEKSSASAPKSY